MDFNSISDIVSKIIDEILISSAFQVDGPEKKYRCKATYSLFPKFETSPLVSDAVNAVCTTVNTFVTKKSEFAKQYNRFFFEVLCKVNRVGELIVKIVFLNEVLSADGGTLWVKWNSSTESNLFVQALKAEHPALVAVVAHVDLEPGKCNGAKPTKKSSYIPLTADGRLTINETTTNGFTYELSTDSFCEVNPVMEDKIFYFICRILELTDGGKEERKKSNSLFLSGRDILSMSQSLRHYYSSCTAVTTCPSVYRDSVVNNMSWSELADKNRIFCSLEAFCQNEGEKHVIMTSGRHGLHPSSSVALVNLAKRKKLSDFVYISCNKLSLTRDFFILKEGFRMWNVACFDFFPGTSYKMIVVHWKPYQLESLRGSLLVLPIGPPGSGKSVCGRKLKELLCCREAQIKLVFESSQEGLSSYILEPDIAISTSVPRHFLSVEPSFSIDHVERDLIFQSFKNKKNTFRRSKSETHAKILNEIRKTDCVQRVLYLDSTNSSVEARKLYSDLWRTSQSMSFCGEKNTCKGYPEVLSLHFSSWDVQLLLDRVKYRTDHPSFPSEAALQKKKMESILSALGEEKSCNAYGAFTIPNEGLEAHTVSRVQFAIFSHLFLSSDLALELCNSVLC